MDSLLSAADAQADQEDYFLDLDAGADAGMEDFDFKLDGTYDDATQDVSPEIDAGSAAMATADFEIGYEDDEAALLTEDTTNAGDAGDAEVDGSQDRAADYQDEIGYEDEEPDTNSTGADFGVAGSGIPGRGQEPVSNEHEQPQVLDDPSLNEEYDESDGEDPVAFDVSADALADTTDSASTERSRQDHTQTPASGLGDFQGTPADISSASLASAVPEIIVHYNQGRYSLIGAPSDDPDSYFFSATRDLGGSLSQLLSSIRAVISDEISAEDELVVRIEALDLEFGEKSSQKFLDRNFYEILRCFSALFGDSENEAQELELDLLMRRDCETRFIELLEEAGLADEPVDQSTGFGCAEDGALDPEDISVDFHEDLQTGEDVVDATTSKDSPAAPEPDQGVIALQAAPQNGEEQMDASVDVHTNPSGTDSIGLGQRHTSNEHIFQEEYLEINTETTNEMDHAENGEGFELEDVDAVDDLDEVFANEEVFDEQHLAIDMAGQPILEEGADHLSGELSGQAGINTGEVSTSGEIGVTDLHEPALHGNNVVSNVDTGSALTTIHEPDAAEDSESHKAHSMGSGLPDDNNASGDVPIIDSQEVKSRHTSRTSTINGDEVDHDKHSWTGYEPSAQGSERPKTPADEIGWENDGEGDGEQDVTAPTPGKRSRTNETEGLPDGTDNKRRRT